MAQPLEPRYMPYMADPALMLQSMQHSNLDKNINESVKDLTRDVANVDRHLSDGVNKTNEMICATGANIKDAIGGSVLGVRDSLDRNGIATSTHLTNLGNSSSDRDRDILTAIERNANENRYSSAVLGAANRQSSSDQTRDVLQAVERTAGENRYSYAVASATDRQANNDLARDGMNQTNRGINEVITSVDRNGSALISAIQSSSYETRNLVNTGNNSLSNTIVRSGSELTAAASAHYASLLLEQQRAKDALALQLAEAKYEALKNKECLSAQVAASSCDAKFEALKNTQMLEKCCCEVKEKIAATASETKYEALKNTQTLSAQLAECCCEVKGKIGDVSHKLDDTVRTLDNQRVRDALNTANNEVNLLRVLDGTRYRGYGRCRSRSRSRSPPGRS